MKWSARFGALFEKRFNDTAHFDDKLCGLCEGERGKERFYPQVSILYS